MPPVLTRTLHPLPFEHLEPKRFEDLTRQLAYDFRHWRQLEATGRSGSDEGFDARGLEIVPRARPLIASEDADDTEDTSAASSDRLWLIQCKREKVISPAKMRAHLATIPPESIIGLYGVLFSAACDLSVATREIFSSWARDHELGECVVWGRGELEDMIYQPKNDNLLFAYFGISLRLRRQAQSTNIRHNTAVKRKISRLQLSSVRGSPVIVRDASDERFPYAGDVNLSESDFLWRVHYSTGIGVKGLLITLREHHAYFDKANGGWDIASGLNLAIPHDFEDPWSTLRNPAFGQTGDDGYDFWVSLPERNRYSFFLYGEIAYEDILEIDDVGDRISKLPTVYVGFRSGKIPFLKQCQTIFEPIQSFAEPEFPALDRHVRVFPESTRDAEWETDWANRNEIELSKERFEVELSPPDWLVGRQSADGKTS